MRTSGCYPSCNSPDLVVKEEKIASQLHLLHTNIDCGLSPLASYLTSLRSFCSKCELERFSAGGDQAKAVRLSD